MKFLSAIVIWTLALASGAQAIEIPEAEKLAFVPEGFKYEILVQGSIPEPVELDFSPDGRLWFTSRRGQIWTLNTETKAQTEIKHPLKVIAGLMNESGERGLHGVAFDPDFLKNGFMYVYYAPKDSDGPANRLSRVTVSEHGLGSEILAGSEKIFLTFPSDTNGFHQGGAVEYNPKDGKLYVTTGDNNDSNKTEKFYNDLQNRAQNLGDYRGKTLRFNLDGTVPKDNPFVNQAGAKPEIFTYGHRNPYSMNIDDETGRVYVGEVGFDRPQDYEEINLLQAGANYGWPRCMGPNLGTYGGDCPITNAVPPFIYWLHDQGANAVSGPVYRKNSGKYAFPPAYQNGMFYADWVRKYIRFAPINPVTGVAGKSQPFARGFGGPLSMKTGPDGALYFTEYTGWFTGSPNDRISRIVYRGKP